MDTGIFLGLFRQALDQVEQIYYGTAWWNASMFNSCQGYEDDSQRMILADYLERYDERVFCYELYHQVRLRMEVYRIEHPEDRSPLLFQGELRKEQINDIVAKHFQVQQLEKAYLRDCKIVCVNGQSRKMCEEAKEENPYDHSTRTDR